MNKILFIILIGFSTFANLFANDEEPEVYYTSFGTEAPFGIEQFRVTDKYSCQILSEETKEARIVETNRCMGAGSWSYNGDCVIPATFEKDGVEYTITTLGKYSFTIGVKSIVLPETIKYIEEGCLYHTDCTEIKLPESLLSIVSSFNNNDKIKTLELPSRLQYIGRHAFAYNNSLEAITFNPGLLSIGESAFSNNPALKEALLPYSVREISDGAFDNCESLERVRIPRFLHFEYTGSIIGGFFNNCPNIKLIECDAAAPGNWGKAFDKVDKKNCTVVVPDGCKENYTVYPFWKEFNVVERSEYASGVVNILSQSKNFSGIYTLTGMKVNDLNILSHGEMYLEVTDGKVMKKIKN